MRRSLTLTILIVAFAATNMFALTEARLTGKVVDAATKQPILDAAIKITSAETSFNYNQDAKVNPKDGTYAIFILDGTKKYKFTFTAPGYASYEEVIKLKLGQPNSRNVELPKAGTVVASGNQPEAKADPAVTLYNDGAGLANEGKLPEAIAKMEEAIVLKPEFPAAYSALARLYLRTKNYPKAIERATKALSYDAEDADMNIVMYESLTATGDKAKAAEYKAKAPANPGELFNDAAKLINAGKDHDAEALLKQAIAADEKFAQAYYELGMVYVRTGKSADAKSNLLKYIELSPTGKDVGTAKEMLNYLK